MQWTWSRDKRSGWRLRACLAGNTLLLCSAAAVAQVEAPGEAVTIPGADLGDWGKVEQVAGRFGLPTAGSGKVPAVLILHGSGGIDGRGAFYARALQEAGFATLEITMFERGTRPGPSVHLTMPHAAAALRWLAAQPGIDARKLGVMGFSWGGQMTVMLSSSRVQEQLGKGSAPPAAFVSMYPICTNMSRFLVWDQHALYNAHLTMGTAPLLIVVGTRDDYEDNERSCDAFLALLPESTRGRTTVRYLDGATHGFDQAKPLQFYDSFAKARKGATINVVPTEHDAAAARAETVSFFSRHLLR
jgi:dienelactone hydrolase